MQTRQVSEQAIDRLRLTRYSLKLSSDTRAVEERAMKSTLYPNVEFSQLFKSRWQRPD